MNDNDYLERIGAIEPEKRPTMVSLGGYIELLHAIPAGEIDMPEPDDYPMVFETLNGSEITITTEEEFVSTFGTHSEKGM